MRRIKKYLTALHITIAALCALGAAYISYIILDPNNQFGFASLMLWMGINIIPTFVGMMFTGSTNDSIGIVFYITVALQWFIIGVYISNLILKHWEKQSLT
ncbi:MAG: hypothetical protein WDA22_14900 [Bacteroidota bacterium]